MIELAGWVVVAIALTVLAVTWRSARSMQVTNAEEQAFRAVNRAPNAMHPPVWAVMQSGSLAAVFVVGAILWLADRSTESWMAIVVGTAVWGGVKLVKRFAGRGRPEAHLENVHVRGPAQTGLGFPSGHAAVALTLALIATHDTSPAVLTLAVAAAVVTGVARMYVGAHLPLDVVGGLAIGTIVGLATRLVL